MRQPRYIVMPLTALGLMLVVFPIFDVMVQSLPLRFSNVQWRFGLQGMLGASLPLVLVGVLFLYGAALQTENYKKIRAVCWFAMFLAVAAIALVASFSLDTVQIMSTIRPVAKTSFKHLTLTTLVRDVFSILVLATVAWSARRAAADLGPSRTRDASDVMLARPMVKPVVPDSAPAAPIAPARD